MAKGKKTGGRNFEKGDQRCWRKGKSVVPEDLKLLNTELKNDALKHLHKYWFMLVEFYAEDMKRKGMTMGERMIGAAYGKAAKDGNLMYVEAILNRIIGKPVNSDPQAVSVNVGTGPTITFEVGKKPDEQSKD
jgi:hypothetical protein